MQVKSKIFPYPVLNNNKVYSNFPNAFFEISFTPAEDELAYVLSDIKFSTDSKLVNDLFDEEKIEIRLVVECSDTVFRKAFIIGKEPKNIKLFKSDFTEKVDISMFAVATQDFVMSSNEFDEDYQNIDFEIEKYDIVCANDGFNVRFKHDESENNLVKSIFSIIPNENINDGTFEVDCEMGKKITISLSDEDYKNCKIVNTVPTYKEVVFNMLLVPSLIEGLTLCKKTVQDGSNDLDDVGNKYTWFRSILSSYKRLYGKDLTLEDFINVSPVLLAQQLLGKPLGEALKKMVVETNRTDGGDANE